MKPARSKQLRKGGAKSRSGQLTQDPVEVFCRVRPLNHGSTSCLQVISPTTVQFSLPDNLRNGINTKDMQYTFKTVFDVDSTQAAVFNTVALPLVKQLLAGKNGILFTYGVTGSGKTYSMTGESHNPGIMPRCLDVIFSAIAGAQAKKYIFKPDRLNGFEIQDEEEADLAARNDKLGYMKTPKTPRRKDGDCDVLFSCGDSDSIGSISIDEDNMFSCFVTYVEIYNNSVFDLLDPTEEAITRKLQNKVIREDGNRNMYVHGVTEVEVKSPEDAFEVFSRGQKRKRVAHTLLNEESSRSHSVFNIRLVQAPLDDAGDDALLVRKLMTISQLSLVDLAGSERTNRTKTSGQRLREAGSINNSLMTLRTCLEILRENQQTGNCKMVPYRDSKLTHLFKNYFDGEGAVRMIVCVNPRLDDCDETAHVLKFAELTQEVQVARPTPQRIDVGMTPGRRRAQLFRAAEEVFEPTVAPVVAFSRPAFSHPWPSLDVMRPNDEEALRCLENFLIQRQHSITTAFNEEVKLRDALRPDLMRCESDLIAARQDNVGLRGLLELERKKTQNNDDKLSIYSSEKYELQQKLNERDQMVRTLQNRLEEKELVINQQGLEKEKVKEKCQNKIQQRDKRIRREMQMKILQSKEEWAEENRAKDEKIRQIKEVLADTPNITHRLPRKPILPLSAKSVNTAGTLYQPSSTPVSHGSSAVSNPRHRRSRSAGGGDRWLDHRPAQPVELSTVFQPTMRKRKSITKLTDMKDVVNSKTTKYCLTTQQQDTVGQLETKLYKGDVVPTCSGGAQVILHDVETLKQSSPTSTILRKRSVPDENTEARCMIGMEGHNKRPKSKN